MELTTTNAIPGKVIVKNLGLVHGAGRWHYGTLADLVLSDGWTQYVMEMNARAELSKNAEGLGADAVVGIVQSVTPGPRDSMLWFFTGTAVKLEDIKKESIADKYDRAQRLLDIHDYLGAEALFFELGSFRDSMAKANEAWIKMSEHRKDTEYQNALKLLSMGDYVLAKEKFDSLGDFRDSANKVELEAQKNYEEAKLLVTEGAYELALQKYLSLSKYQYRDSAMRATEVEQIMKDLEEQRKHQDPVWIIINHCKTYSSAEEIYNYLCTVELESDIVEQARTISENNKELESICGLMGQETILQIEELL